MHISLSRALLFVATCLLLELLTAALLVAHASKLELRLTVLLPHWTTAFSQLAFRFPATPPTVLADAAARELP